MIPVAALALATGIAAVVPGGSAAGTSAGSSSATVRVVLKEWKLTTSAGKVAPGRVTFVVRNAGKMQHELVVLRTSRHHHSLKMRGSVADEKGSEGEIARIGPGKTRRLTVTLRRGSRVLLCNLPGHYRAGQYSALRVG